MSECHYETLRLPPRGNCFRRRLLVFKRSNQHSAVLSLDSPGQLNSGQSWKIAFYRCLRTDIAWGGYDTGACALENQTFDALMFWYLSVFLFQLQLMWSCFGENIPLSLSASTCWAGLGDQTLSACSGRCLQRWCILLQSLAVDEIAAIWHFFQQG